MVEISSRFPPPVQLALFLVGLFGLGGCVTQHNALYQFGVALERGLARVGATSIDVNGETFAYLERKGEGEVIVLLHGFAANKDNWVRFVRHLPRSYPVLIFDLPGHGDSSFDPQKSYDAFALTERIAVAFEQLGLKRFHLAGNSLGGWVATLYAIDHPEKMLTLGLFESSWDPPSGRK